MIEPYWGVGDFSAFIGRPESWVYDNWRKLGIPFVKIGRALKIKPSKAEAWAEAQAA